MAPWTKIRFQRASLALAVAVVLGALLGCSREPRPTPTARPVGQATPTHARSSQTGSAVTPASVPTADQGLPNVGSLVAPSTQGGAYTVQRGDTLSAIAGRFGVSLEALTQANRLADPNALQVGQKLIIPGTIADVGPADLLLPDSEFVNGPAYVHFDLIGFCMEQGGHLMNYTETVGKEVLSGPEIVRRVAHQYSVGPRLLLAVLDALGGWVTNPSPSARALSFPLGYRSGGTGSLWRELSWAANELNEGYYDWRGRGAHSIVWSDGSATAYADTLNAATAGLQHYFALVLGKSEWLGMVGTGPGSFLDSYRRLFGDPFQYAVEPLVSASTPLPTLRFPWPDDERWYYTSGPHGGWGEGSAWAAIDAVPDEGYLGCAVARSWATAAAPGLVIYSQEGYVIIDLDGDGHEQTGWVLLYLHMAAAERVPVDTRVQTGDRIGHPSCQGGAGSQASHLHFARKYNGEWIAADGPLPLILSGWQFHSSGKSYDGTATRGEEVRTACECLEPEVNGLTARK